MEPMGLKHLPQHVSRWLWQASDRLSIGQKIGFGYGVALGLAVLGTTSGLIVGNNYYQTARRQMFLADTEIGLLNNCQGVLLKINSHQQNLVTFLHQPQQFQKSMAELEVDLEQIQAFVGQLHQLSNSSYSQTQLQEILREYDRTLPEYIQGLRALMRQLSPLMGKLEAVPMAQKLAWQFHQSQAAIELNEFTQELGELAKTVQVRQQQANIAQNKAAAIQANIIIASMLVSTAMATFIAAYTTHAIATPIRRVAEVAQQVTQTANLDLQVPVSTKDEVGELTTSLNQLIQQVKHLLAAQQAEAEIQLIQSEKMSSLGQMLAGIAHDINNPVNFISGNLIYAKQYFDDLLALVQAYQTAIPQPPTAVQAKVAEIDLEFLQVDLPKLLNSLEIGANRTRELVLCLKDFSRIDEGEAQNVDLHACIDSTLLLLNNRLKNSINVIRNYGNIPAVSGYSGALYQVFMNLISNAIDAVEEKSTQTANFLPQITIVTERLESNWVTVRIRDNGTGITTENQSKIFDTFFTTKPRGIGTGLGLAISQQIVVEKHQGKIDCHTELNKGTEFAIALPIHQPATMPATPPSVINTNIQAA